MFHQLLLLMPVILVSMNNEYTINIVCCIAVASAVAAPSTATQQFQLSASQTKLPRIDLTDFEDTVNSEIDVSERDVDELTVYLNMRIAFSADYSILSWWKEHAVDFPKLSAMTRQLLAITASSAASERSFSAAGSTVSERRTNLSSGSVENILFMHSNLQ